MYMRVLCINGVKTTTIGELSYSRTKVSATLDDCIYEGHSYEVDVIEFFNGKSYYKLIGKPTLSRYLTSRFIELSNIDEFSLVNTKEECV